MAFNPFHRFRKHQKVFFAVLTIVCMITFIFSFGQGDLVHRVMAWFGASRARGDVVVKVYGDKVYEGDLSDLGQRRKMADAIIRRWAGRGADAALTQLEKQSKDPKANVPAAVKEALQAREREREQRFRFMQQFRMNFPPDYRVYQEQLNRLAAELRNVESGDVSAAGKKDIDPKELQAEQTQYLKRAISVFTLETWASAPLSPEEERPKGENARPQKLYFGGSTNADGLLDFLVWKHQADRLGIVLTDEGLHHELTRAAAGEDLFPGKNLQASIESWLAGLPLESRNDPFGQQLLQAIGRYQAPDILAALKDELRVAMAKEALLGGGPGVRKYRNEALGINPPPSLPTPDQLLEYYREQRTTLKVALLDIPVAHFMGQVKGAPSQAEIDNLWDTYKDIEYNPASPTPGYKIPKRIKVELALGSPESAAYEKEAAKVAPLQEALPYLIPPAGIAPFGVSVSPAVVQYPLLERYAEYRSKVTQAWQGTRTPRLDRPFEEFPSKPGLALDAATEELRQLSVAGQTLMAGTNPLAALVAPGYLRGAEALHRRAVAEVAAASMLAPTVRLSPFSALLLPHPFYYSKASLEQVLPELGKDYRKKVAGDLFRKNIATFRTELSKLATKPAEARKYVAEAAKKYHLTLRETKEITPYTAEYDPVLQPLLQSTSYKDQPDMLVQTLFQDAGTRFAPREVPGEKGEQILWWRTDYHAAATPSKQAALPEIVKTWKLNEARLKAHAEADRIKEALKNKAPTEIIPYLESQAKLVDGKEFALANVARLAKPEEPQHVPITEYRPYQLPLKDRPLMRYPPADLVGQLMTLQKRGDAMVFADEPSEHYYVAVLDTRTHPRPNDPEFREAYKSAPRGPLWQRAAAEHERDFVHRMLKDLRADAVGAQNLNSAGEYIINDAVRQRLSSGREQ